MALLNDYTPADLAMQVYTDFRTVDKERSDIYQTMGQLMNIDN
jgi:hypothetical protein